MATLALQLPPHCQVKNRGRYADVYFMVHPKDRPESWRATFKLGRTDHDPVETIVKKAWEVYNEYEAFCLAERGVVSLPRERRGTIPDLIKRYRASGYWKDLAPNTRQDYERYLQFLVDWSARNKHPLFSEMKTVQAVAWLNGFDHVPMKQRRAKAVLSTLNNYAIIEGLVERNFIREIKLRRRKTPARRVITWSDDDVLAFIAQAEAMGYPSLGTAALIAFEIGQRQGDVRELQKPRDYHDGRFQFHQSKTGQYVSIRATARLKARLSSLPEEQSLLVTHDNTGKQWERGTFGHTFRRVADKAGLKNHIFMQLRHTAVIPFPRPPRDPVLRTIRVPGFSCERLRFSFGYMAIESGL
jgi:hypothetical protein